MVTFGLGGLGGRLFPMDWEVWSPKNLENFLLSQGQGPAKFWVVCGGPPNKFLEFGPQTTLAVWGGKETIGKMGVFNPDFFPELSPKTLGKKRGIFSVVSKIPWTPPFFLWFSFGLASR